MVCLTVSAWVLDFPLTAAVLTSSCSIFASAAACCLAVTFGSWPAVLQSLRCLQLLLQSACWHAMPLVQVLPTMLQRLGRRQMLRLCLRRWRRGVLAGNVVRAAQSQRIWQHVSNTAHVACELYGLPRGLVLMRHWRAWRGLARRRMSWRLLVDDQVNSRSAGAVDHPRAHALLSCRR